MNFVPGACAMFCARNVRTQFSSFTHVCVGSFSLPVDMESRSFTRMAARLSLIFSGSSFGKNEITLSSTLIFPSATAKPTAVEVKLLLIEYIVCTNSAP